VRHGHYHGTICKVNSRLRALAIATEMHEATVWADCFDAVARLPDNPLGAVVDRTASPPLALLAATNSLAINRVVGLGLSSPATGRTISSIADFYRSHGQRTFRIELSPAASPRDVADLLEAVGFRREEKTNTKMWCSTQQQLPATREIDVQRLGPEHRDAVAELNAVAWGAWGAEDLRPWFGATVGRPPFRHYGVFDDGLLVSVGVLAVVGTLGWMGFAATHPRYRRHGLRRGTELARITGARDLGCEIVHMEIATEYTSALRHPFEKLCERELYQLGCAPQ
jgi:hypothetical protein